MALELVASFRDAKKDSQALSSVIFSLELEGAKEKGGGHSGGGNALELLSEITHALWVSSLAEGQSLWIAHCQPPDEVEGRRLIRGEAAGTRAGNLKTAASHCSRGDGELTGTRCLRIWC